MFTVLMYVCNTGYGYIVAYSCILMHSHIFHITLIVIYIVVLT